MKRARTTQGYSVARRTYEKDDETHEAARYRARFKDHRDIWHRVPAYTDLGASTELARKLRRIAELKAAGQPPDPTLAKWIDGLSEEIRDRLIEWEVLDRRASMSTWPIADHIRDWTRSILADGVTADHAALVKARVEAIVSGCGFARLASIDDLAVKDWLAGQTMKLQTRNHYVRAIKQFCRWLVDHGRATNSPVAGLKVLTVTDKRERRALSITQLRKLLQAAEKGPTHHRMTGPDRATLYWLAAETGLRAAELGSLTASSFKLDANPPTVTVQAAYAKNRRADTLALTAELAARLKLAQPKHVEPDAPAFKLPTKTAEMVRHDLERAGIPIETADGHFDFHALRVQCASNLARGGAHPAVAQARMRHSTIKLTMDLYTKLGQDEQAAALDALPRLSASA